MRKHQKNSPMLERKVPPASRMAKAQVSAGSSQLSAVSNVVARLRRPPVLRYLAVNFSPTMPATINTMHTSRAAVAGSLNSKMPAIAVPTAPMPVQIA